MKTNYDKISPFYDFLSQGSERKFREKAIDILSPVKGERVLETGFGPGRGLVLLGRRIGPTGFVKGVDLSSEMVKRAKRRVVRAGLAERVEVIKGDGRQLPFEKGSFDAVFMSFTLELFEESDIHTVVQECRRVLTEKGRLCLAFMSDRSENIMTRLYKRAHRIFPDFIDCRPISVEETLIKEDFLLMQKVELSMWGLPVDIALARPRSGSVHNDHKSLE